MKDLHHIMDIKEIIGIDIGGTKCAVSLGKFEAPNREDCLSGQNRSTKENLTVLDKRDFKTADYSAPQEALQKFVEEIGRLSEGRKIVGIGISCGGPLDSGRGVILSPPNLPGWDTIPICASLEELFHVPVAISNDANACAIAEWRFGAGRGTENFIYLTCGTGIGAGLILGGRLYSGRQGMAGELGHWRMQENGPVGYGKEGSLEGFFSGGGIARFSKMRLLELKQCGENIESLDDYVNGKRELTAREVFRLAKEKESYCMSIIEEAGTMLGHGIAMLIDLLNPEVIVGGSIFTRNYDLLYPIIKKVVESEALPQSAIGCRILPSELGENIGDIAALAVAPLERNA